MAAGGQKSLIADTRSTTVWAVYGCQWKPLCSLANRGQFYKIYKYYEAPIPYSDAKARIQILTQVVAAQAGPFGVRVHCVAPETILTDRPRANTRTAVINQLDG